MMNRFGVSESDLSRTGVYRITTPRVNDLAYIGSAARSLKRRWITHQSALRKGVHHCPRLQAVVRKYGMSTLQFEVLCFCHPDDCVPMEQTHMDAHPGQKLYNINPLAGSRLGATLTPEQRRLLTERHGGISSPDLLARVIAEYEQGGTQTELAKKYGVDRASIRNYLRRSGVRIRPQPTQSDELRTAVVGDYSAGSTIQKIAQKHEIDYETVWRILGKIGRAHV